MKKIIFSVITSIISFLILLIAIEIILRVFAPQQESMKWFIYNDKYGFVNKANFEQEYNYVGTPHKMLVKTNSYGHRYLEYKENDFNNNKIKKILISGDSFAFGYGINMQNHFALLLDSLLNKEDKIFSIINSGVGGWGTVQEKNYALNNLHIFMPDIIILLFFQNDPYNDYRFLENLDDYKVGKINFPGKRFLKHHSHLYWFLFYNISPKIHKYQLKKAAKSNPQIIQNDEDPQIISQEQWNTTFYHINDFYDNFKKFNDNGKFIVLSATPWDNNQNERFAKFVDDKDIYFLDLYDYTVKIPPEDRRLEFDYHWSPLIHKIIANNLSDLIIDLF